MLAFVLRLVPMCKNATELVFQFTGEEKGFAVSHWCIYNPWSNTTTISSISIKNLVE